MVKETVYERRGRGRAVAHELATSVRKLQTIYSSLAVALHGAHAVDGSDGGDDPTAPFTELLGAAQEAIQLSIARVTALRVLAKEVAKTPTGGFDHGSRLEYDDASELAADGTPSDEEPSG